MMCEAARSLSALMLPTCPDGNFIVEYMSSSDAASASYFSKLHSFDSNPKVVITSADYSSDLEDAAQASNQTISKQRPQFYLQVPSIFTTSFDETVKLPEVDDVSHEQVDQRYLYPAGTPISTRNISDFKEKFITREVNFLRRSASFTSPYKVARRLSHDCNTNTERKPTFLTRTLSFIKNKMEFASTSALYPPKEEIRKWQHSFERLLHHKYGCMVFRDFLKTEFSVENIDFWLECEEFKKMKEGKKSTIQKARSIYKLYIVSDSPKEINIDAEVRNATKAAIDDGAKPNTFFIAQTHVEQLMEKDSYNRFIRSEHFQKLLQD